MHCGAEQGKIVLDKPTTFKEKKMDKGEHKLNARDIREWLERIPDEDLIFIGMDHNAKSTRMDNHARTTSSSDYRPTIHYIGQW